METLDMVMDALQVIETDCYLPVLVITAQPAHKTRALQAGARDFISKPFDLVEVRTRIRNMLEVRLLHKKLDAYNKTLEETVQERAGDLLKANVQLTQERALRAGTGGLYRLGCPAGSIRKVSMSMFLSSTMPLSKESV